MLTLLLVKQETVEHAKFRALSQIIIDKNKGIEAFEEYMKVAFPYLEAIKKRERVEPMKQLKEWVSRGPMSIRVLSQPKLSSRVVTAKSRTQPQTAAEEKRLYKKIGRTI